MKKLNQKGSTYIVALLAVLVVAGIGLIGYRALKSTDDSVSTSPSISSTTGSTPDKINSKADAQKASAALDSTSIDSSVNPSQMDNDLNSLL